MMMMVFQVHWHVKHTAIHDAHDVGVSHLRERWAQVPQSGSKGELNT